jgi:nucleoside 2-deoxyribosyltransferase
MKCFVIMPWRQEFNEVHATMKRAVAGSGVGEVLRLDEVRAAGHITSDLVAELHEADFCIADLTDPTANVRWEVGYAAALTKPTTDVTAAAIGAPPGCNPAYSCP